MTLTSHDPKTPNSRQKNFFNIFVPYMKDYQHAKKISCETFSCPNLQTCQILAKSEMVSQKMPKRV